MTQRPETKPDLKLSVYCKACGIVLDWPKPVGVVLGDGTALCHDCLEAGK